MSIKRHKIFISLSVITIISLALFFILSVRVSPSGLYRSRLVQYLDGVSTGYLYFSDGKLYTINLHPQEGITAHQYHYTLTKTGDIAFQPVDEILVMKSYLWGINIKNVDDYCKYAFRSWVMPNEIREYLQSQSRED